MSKIRMDEKSVYIDLWGETLEYDRIQYALYQLNSAFELRISEDTDTILNYRLNGVPYKVSTVNGQQTNDICPYSWESLEYVSKTIGEAGRRANEILAEYGIELNPNWKEINKQWFAEVDRLEKLFGDALGKATQAALNNQAYKYQQAYNEELSKDFGLSFGVLSSSLTAHLLYAAQSAAKERKDHARAEKAAAEVMQNSHADITSQIFASVYPLYADSLEPAMQKLLSQYYAYIISIFSKELGYPYEDIAATFNFKKSNGFILGLSENGKHDILKALQADPNNGNVIGCAIKNGILDNELCAYGKGAQPNFGNILKKWAISVLSEIYNAGKLFNKPLVTNENESIITGLISYYTFVSGIAIASEDWQDIILEVYGEEIDMVEKTFEIFAKVKESNNEIIKLAQENKKITISDNEIARFIVVACELKHVDSQWYASCMDLDANGKIAIQQIRDSITIINQKINTENDKIKEREEKKRKKEQERREAEEQRRAELKKQKEVRYAKFKKVAKLVGITIVSVILVSLLVIVVMKITQYNKAIDLQERGEYESAIDAFEDLNGIFDSDNKILETYYLMGEAEFNKENYVKAIDHYTNAKDFGEASNQIVESKYMLGKQYYDNKNFSKSYEVFDELSTYKDSVALAKQSAINAADSAMSSKNYQSAVVWYEAAGKSEDVKNAKYLYINSHLDSNNETTFEYLKDLKGISYKDTTKIYDKLYQIKFEFIVNESPTDYSTNMSRFKYYSGEHLGGYIYVHYRISGGTPGQKMHVNYDGWQTGSGTVKCDGSWNTLTDGRFLAYGSSSTSTTLKFTTGFSGYNEKVLAEKKIVVYQ